MNEPLSIEELHLRLAQYRAAKVAAAWLEQRFWTERTRQYWPGAREWPARDAQLRLGT